MTDRLNCWLMNFHFFQRVMSLDYSGGMKLPNPDPIFLYIEEGMTVIVTNPVRSGWRMADVLDIDRCIGNPGIPAVFHVAYLDTGVSTWIKPELVTHIVPRL